MKGRSHKSDGGAPFSLKIPCIDSFEKESDCCDLQVGVSPSPDRHHEQGGAGTGQAVPRLALYHSAATNFLQASCHSLRHSSATHIFQAS